MTKKGLKKIAFGAQKGVSMTGEAAMAVGDKLSNIEKNETTAEPSKKGKKKGDKDESVIVDWVALDEVNQTAEDEDEIEAPMKHFANRKEIFVFRRRKVVHIYDVVELGWFSFLLFYF